MNENESPQASQIKIKRRSRGVQRKESGSKSQDSAKKIIADCNRQEEQLFTARGHGGYINSEALRAIREKRDAASKQIRK